MPYIEIPHTPLEGLYNTAGSSSVLIYTALILILVPMYLFFFFSSPNSTTATIKTPLIHIIQPDTNRPAMSLQLLHLRQLHHRPAHIHQAFHGEIRAGDVLGERSEVDARVLLRIAIGCCSRRQHSRKRIPWRGVERT